jgi:hypothetical protein
MLKAGRFPQTEMGNDMAKFLGMPKAYTTVEDTVAGCVTVVRRSSHEDVECSRVGRSIRRQERSLGELISVMTVEASRGSTIRSLSQVL